MQRHKKKLIVPLILISIFILPGISAYILYTHPNWLKTSTNRGEFIQPPLQLKELPKNNKWRLVYYSKTTCNDKCMGNLDKLARVRLALGRHLYNVDSCLLLPDFAKSITSRQEKILHDIGIDMLIFSPDKHINYNIFTKNAYFIINEDNYAILTYSENTAPDDIFQDIKKLVKDK